MVHLLLDVQEEGFYSYIIHLKYITKQFFQTTEKLIQYPFSYQDFGGQIKLFAAIVCVLGMLPLLVKI